MRDTFISAPGDVPPRRAKIVCTLGPATHSPERLAALLDAGMDVARLNFSHGTPAEHARRLRLLRALARQRAKTLAILQDLQGPKIRTGPLERGARVELRAGARVTLTTRPLAGNAQLVSTNFQALPREVRAGNRILLSDGLIELCVERVAAREVVCRVVEGGELGEHQGINLPGLPLKISALTAKDRADLRFGIENGVDYVALSFVRRPEDVLELKRLLKRAGRQIPVIAKLEKPEAIDRLEEILRVADAVMVARGDLGVELPPERVPVIQKRVIAQANALRVPVITATQMLESMTVHSRPTRAEASDVANAIFDGADALMLSAETAVGRYPEEAVRMMARIISAAEASPRYGWYARLRRQTDAALGVPEAICESVAHMTGELKLKAIAVFTQSGSSARLISKYRPRVPVFAFSPLPKILRRAALYWGVIPVHMPHVQSTDRMVEGADRLLRGMGVVEPGDVIAVIAGTPIARRGTTNLLKVHRIEKSEGRNLKLEIRGKK
jgi:pyruvate kinase